MVVLATVLAAVGPTAPAAAADRDLAARFSANGTGDVVVAANTLLTCPAAEPTCAGAQNGAAINNNSYSMVPVDVDGDPATTNSSTADLDLPDGAGVLFAGLYYGAMTASVQPPAALSQVKLRAPGDGAYRTVGAAGTTVVDQSSENGRRYQGFVDVTPIVARAGPGTYTVADVRVSPAIDRYAGWALVVAYADPRQPPRSLSVFDGLVSVPQVTQTTITARGFTTPATGPVRTRLGIVAYEGDIGAVGDVVTVDDRSVSGPLNPANNFFNSSITRLGERVGAKRPDYVNQLGFDADVVNADGLLPNGATSAAIRFKASVDQYLPGVVTFATELPDPVITTTKAVANLSRPGTSAQAGDRLRYTVGVRNSGQGAAEGFVLRDRVPGGARYAAGSLRLSSGAAPTDVADGDAGEYDAAAGAVVLRLGTGANGESGGRVGPGDNLTASFEVTVGEGLPDGAELVNQASADYRSEALGTPYVDQRTPAVVTPVRSPDLTVAVSHDPEYVAGRPARIAVVAANTGGAATRGPVTVSDVLPATGFSAVSAADGAGWTCAVEQLSVVCARDDALDPGSSYPSIFIDAVVRDPPQASIVNLARVQGAGDANPGNDTATDVGPGAASADVRVEKRADPVRVLSGERVRFDVDVQNAGPSGADDVTVTDALPAGLADVDVRTTQGSCTAAAVCRLGRLGRGGSATVTVEATVTANAATLENVATAGASTPDAEPANNRSAAAIVVDDTADLRLTKSGSEPAPDVAEPFSYTVRVRNAGPGAARDVVVLDDLPAAFAATGVTAPAGWDCETTGAAGAQVRCARALLSVADAEQAIVISGTFTDGGFQTNGASVTSNTAERDAADNRATLTVLAAETGDLALRKDFTATGPVLPGATTTFQLRLVNNGPSPASAVTITDDLPAGMSYVSDTAAACLPSAGRLECSLGTLAAGATFAVTVTVRVAADGTTNGRVLENTARVRSALPDPVPGNDVAHATLAVGQIADLSLSKRAAPLAARVGQDVTFTLTLGTTAASSAVADAEIVDRLPDGLSFVSSAACRFDAPERTVTCPVGALAPGRSASAAFVARVEPAAAGRAGGVVTNVATARSSVTDPDPSNNTAGASVTVAPRAGLSLGMVASDPEIGALDAVTYTLTASNAGPSDATGVTIRDPLPAGTEVLEAGPGCRVEDRVAVCSIGDLAVGERAAGTVSVRTTATLAGRSFANTATVAGDQEDAEPGDDTATATVAVRSLVDLVVEKRASADVVASGSELSYVVAVANGGPSTATGVVVTDPLPAGLVATSARPSQGTCDVTAARVRCELGSLAVGGSANVTLAARATGEGRIQNVAQASAREPESTPRNTSATASVLVTPAAASPAPAPAVGDRGPGVLPAPARTCQSRRRFSIRLLEPPRPDRLRSARVFVEGRPVRVVRRHGRLVALVDLRGRPKARYAIRVTARTRGGKTLRDVRRYRTCIPRPPAVAPAR